MLTAWESLEFYTQLSLPVLLSTEDRHARMDTVLETMGLAHVKHTKVRRMRGWWLPCASACRVACLFCAGHAGRAAQQRAASALSEPESGPDLSLPSRLLGKGAHFTGVRRRSAPSSEADSPSGAGGGRAAGRRLHQGPVRRRAATAQRLLRPGRQPLCHLPGRAHHR